MNNIEVDEIKSKLKSKLTFKAINGLNTKQFKLFAHNFFEWLDVERNNGLKSEHLKELINEVYYIQSDYFDQNSVSIFESRIEIFVEEIYGTAPAPRFWEVDFKLFSEKLDKWLKHIK